MCTVQDGVISEAMWMRKSRKFSLHGVSICVLVRHLPAALDDDEEQESCQRVGAFHCLSFWKMSIEREKHCETTPSEHIRANVYPDKIFWIVERSKVQIFSPVLLSVERLREQLWSALTGALLSFGLWSCFTVPSWSARSYIVELSGVLPGDSPVTETSAYPLLLSTH